MTSQVIALGGGGFLMEQSLLLERYVIENSRSDNPRICFISTASGDNDAQVAKFYTAFSKLPCRPLHLPFFRYPLPEPAEVISSSDIIYVGGGNTRAMLAVWREWHIDELLGKAYQRGAILSGMSAGAICWFEQGHTDSHGNGVTLGCLPGLGLLSGSCSPHFDGEVNRRSSFLSLIASKAMKDGYGIDDNVALHFVDGRLSRCVSSSPGKKAVKVECRGLQPYEESIIAEFLG